MINARDAYARSRVVTFPHQLVINNAGKRVLGLGTGEKYAIDEESGCSIHTGLPAFLLILFDVRLVLLVGQAGTKLLVIELQIACVFDQVILLQLRRGEQLIVVLPELSLLQGAARGLSRNHGLGMNRREREVAVGEAHLVSVLGEQLFDRGLHLMTVGTLVVRELNDHHRRFGISVQAGGIVESLFLDFVFVVAKRK